MDQASVRIFSWGTFVWTNGAESSSIEFPPTLVLVHGWLFPETQGGGRSRTELPQQSPQQFPQQLWGIQAQIVKVRTS